MVFAIDYPAVQLLFLGDLTVCRNDSSQVFAISFNANTPVPQLPIHSLSILDLSHLSFTEAMLPCVS